MFEIIHSWFITLEDKMKFLKASKNTFDCFFFGYKEEPKYHEIILNFILMGKHYQSR